MPDCVTYSQSVIDSFLTHKVQIGHCNINLTIEVIFQPSQFAIEKQFMDNTANIKLLKVGISCEDHKKLSRIFGVFLANEMLPYCSLI